MKNVTTRETVPCAYVTKGKQRIKQFEKTVYLNNGDQFEIELFNPTTNKVLAQIELNGISIGGGIVLRPGERVFLERHIETARKFLFETYNVSGSNADVKAAIALNGNVRVKFYAEYIPIVYHTTPTIDWSYWGNYHTGTYKCYPSGIATLDCCGNGNPPVGGMSYLSNSMDNISASTGAATFTSSVNYNDTPKQEINMRSNLKKSKSYQSPGIFMMEKDESFVDEFKQKEIETGRIEKGSVSNQSFQMDNTTFNTYWSWSSNWKILPKSQKPVTSEDLNNLYCGNCGSKKGKGPFCQHCGSNNWIAK